ncbi:hypothetical protein HIM_07642 [Hirsutella minnesotensis 3608]|uniref:Protein BNI4 n=1 Tax=Hirsutella minnesotensis 3608 TaxID=1043627 RepID=A0A0F8A433_9HYPO|nr:hypothetical protein HIM_07642 [Hirsutella minnesotensis 3608]
MAALVQTYPQQTGTVTMLQTRPSSNSGIMSPNQQHGSHQYMANSSQSPRSPYHNTGSSGYRSNTAPVQPYAFTSTPNLNQTLSWQQYGSYRANSLSLAPGALMHDQNANHRIQHPSNASAANTAYSHSFGVSHAGSRDDSALSMLRNAGSTPRPQSVLSVHTQPSFSSGTPGRNAPDRYRRPSGGTHHARSQSSTAPVSMPMTNASQLYAAQANHRYSVPQFPSRGMPGTSLDDMHIQNRSFQHDARRTRRRSMHNIELPDGHKPPSSIGDGSRSEKSSKQSHLSPQAAAHTRKHSSESSSSTRSSHSHKSITNRNAPVSTGTPSSSTPDDASAKNEQSRAVNVPLRGSSSDATKRSLNPSPLSKPATMASDAAEDSALVVADGPGSAGGKSTSSAVKQLAAIQKGGKGKSKTSRLRRAFSFGSAADFRKAAGGEEEGDDRHEPSKLHKTPTPDEAYDAEQARIAEAQEAAGIGTNIYGGRFFGSTDNLSISSTASSASVMIRKMGRGMKKSTRSLVGLFRPKSIVGVPAADGLTQDGSQATVSMITVEAETQRVNVTADPSAANGGTGFPHLERNSLDAAQVPEMAAERLGSSGTDQSNSRKSIVGGDKERADALAAVRKGILKRSTSPSARAAEASPDLVLPNIPAVSDSPSSSAPSTPNDEAQSHKRTGSIAIGNEDYFMSALRLRQDVKSPLVTPQGTKRNATFSPRIVFHDTWPSQEYDRRGDIATCNRLTPMLAQQIKEELNTFKMEMEVHENSKIYTHFF